MNKRKPRPEDGAKHYTRNDLGKYTTLAYAQDEKKGEILLKMLDFY